MRPEQRQMNNSTFRECNNVRNEVIQSRAGKKIKLRDYPAAIVSCANSWNNAGNALTGRSGKVDRDIIDALGRQLIRSATRINANMNEAQHPQSDADFLSKSLIALKESRESESWLHMLSDNGYLDQRMSESILHDCERINKILITITAKVKKRINGAKE